LQAKDFQVTATAGQDSFYPSVPIFRGFKNLMDLRLPAAAG